MKLLKKIKTKKAIIGVVGLGYVGLPLCIRFLEKGFKVKGLDKNKRKVEDLKKYNSHIINVKKNILKKYFSRNFEISSNNNILSGVDILIICVPTPIKKNKDPEMRYIYQASEQIKPYLKKDQAIIVESTVYPGATEEYFVPIIKKLKLSLGKNFFLGFSPEREDPGNKKYSISKGNIPKIVSGSTNNCKKIVEKIYKSISTTVTVSSIKTAEFTKLLENVYRSINIGFVNEMKTIAHSMGINIHEAINAAKSKPFGFQAFYPGPGLGGHCIPIDPHLLAWQAKNFNANANFIKLSSIVNESMCNFAVKILKSALKKNKKNIIKKKILVLGMAYKKNSNDLRESPSFRLIEILQRLGCKIDCSDPYIKNIKQINEVKKLNNINLISINQKNLKKYDAAILITNHDNFKYKLIEKYSKIVIDTRNSFSESSKKVYKA